MSKERFMDVETNRLARLLDMDGGVNGEWSETDLGAILRHQLATPLAMREVLAASEGVATADDAEDMPNALGEVFGASEPSLLWLQRVKRYAKLNLAQHSDALPEPIAAVLYYVSIYLAQQNHGLRISSLTDNQLCEGLRWVRDCWWIADELKAKAEEGVAYLTIDRDDTASKQDTRQFDH